MRYRTKQPFTAEAGGGFFRCPKCDAMQPDGAVRVWVPKKDYVGYSFSAWCTSCATAANLKFKLKDA